MGSNRGKIDFAKNQIQPGGEPINAHYTLKVLITLLENFQVGTNLGLLHFLWALVSGALITEGGAVIPALQRTGLNKRTTRRAWHAFAHGKWNIDELLVNWRKYVEGLTEWTRHGYEGYRPKAVDLAGFFRPTLKNCPSQHYHPSAKRALPAVILGLIGDVGSIGTQRVALPCKFLRVNSQHPSEARLQEDLLTQVRLLLKANEVAILDAGFKLSQIHAAEVTRYVVRLAANFKAQRNQVKTGSGKGRPLTYGETIRPLARLYRGVLKAGTPPDATETWQDQGKDLRAEIWSNLILPGLVPGTAGNQVFTVYAIFHSDYQKPWLLASSLSLTAATIYHLYLDRWPIEQVPLSAKIMIGARRQFVFAKETIQRLPELALLAGSILTVLAALHPAAPTGFWDRRPRRTPGRFRRSLGLLFPMDYALPPQFRQKASVTEHLPTGILGHRRQKSPEKAFASP